MYINRKRIIERLMCSPLTLHLPKNYRDGIKDLLEKAPAVDAVEVVRCEECKDAIPLQHSDYVVCCGRRKMPKTGFCSYGERKDGASNEGESAD